MKKVLSFVFIAALVAGIFGFAAPAGAVEVFDECQSQSSSSLCNPGSEDELLGEGGIITRIINVLFLVVGVVSVLFIIIGGIRYITSNGDSGMITSARQTIMYAIIGLVVALMAAAIVNFVVARLV